MKVILKRVRKKIKKQFKIGRSKYFNPLLVKDKQKIFCIGNNKTGTTSIKKAFEDLGYIVGLQREAEKLARYYIKGDFRPIIDYCRTAQVFQDFPFSCPETYKHLDKAFPGSKFILTVRDSPEQWYKSLVNFHSRKYGNGHVPTKQDLQNAYYVWKGRPWEVFSYKYKTPDDDPYNKAMLISFYNNYNNEIIEYFADRPDDFIVINVGEEGAYQKFVRFLGIDSPYSEFPWENKTYKN